MECDEYDFDEPNPGRGTGANAFSRTAFRGREMRDLGGKVAVVTGAASGIGLALCERFLRDGMKVVLADVEAGTLEREVARLRASGGEVLGVPTDVRHYEQVEALAERTCEHFGGVHLVCNNAGVAPGGPMLEAAPEDWRWVFDVNVMGVANGVRAFGPRLVEAGVGHIVNTASEAGLTTNASLGIYCASKHAVVGLSESLYRELEETPVGVSVVCPNLVRTQIFHSERNRDDGVEAGPESHATMSMLRETIAAMGMTTEEVAEKVRAAVLEDRFWVLTHEETAERSTIRGEDIRAGRNPSDPYADVDIEGT